MYQIYKTTNLINQKYYIGHHKGDIFLDGYWGSGIVLKTALQKYGKENFARVILGTVSTKKCALELERLLVNNVRIRDPKCYNLNRGGSTFKHKHPFQGKKHTEETKNRIRRSLKGRKLSKDTRARISAIHSNRLFSESHKENLSIALKGRKKFEEYKENLSKSIKRAYKNGLIRSKKNRVVHTSTGLIFSSSDKAAEVFKLTGKTVRLHCRLKVSSPLFRYCKGL